MFTSTLNSREKQPYLEQSSHNFKSCYTCVITDAVCLRPSDDKNNEVLLWFSDLQPSVTCIKSILRACELCSPRKGLNLRWSHSTTRTILTSQFENWWSSQHDIHIQICHLTTGIRSEKCVVRTFRRCANAYLHKPRYYNIAYCTPRLYGIAYSS